MRIFLALLVALGASACASDPMDPPPYTVPRVVDEVLPHVSLTLAIDGGATSDTIRFTITAVNASSARVQIGERCGPPIDVLIVTPGGTSRSALFDRAGPNGAFTCELGPQHFLEPHETRTHMIGWPVPDNAPDGRYTAVAGLRRADGLTNISSAITFRR